MATISFLQGRNASMSVDGTSTGITETDASGATMTAGIELNIDKAKVTSKQEIIEALDKFKKAVIESVNLTG
jgi:hypothetical protein